MLFIFQHIAHIELQPLDQFVFAELKKYIRDHIRPILQLGKVERQDMQDHMMRIVFEAIDKISNSNVIKASWKSTGLEGRDCRDKVMALFDKMQRVPEKNSSLSETAALSAKIARSVLEESHLIRTGKKEPTVDVAGEYQANKVFTWG